MKKGDKLQRYKHIMLKGDAVEIWPMIYALLKKGAEFKLRPPINGEWKLTVRRELDIGQDGHLL